MNRIECESCGNYSAAYWADYGRGAEPFAVCFICMMQARRGPRPPLVTIIRETA